MNQQESFDKRNYLNNLMSGKLREKNIILNNVLEESKGSSVEGIAMSAKKIANQLKEHISDPTESSNIPITQNFKFGEAAFLESKSVTEEQIARLTGRPMPKKPLVQAPSSVGQQFLYEEKIPQQKSNNNNINVDINQLKEQLKAELFEEMKEEINMYIMEMFAKQRIKNIIKEIFDESKKK